MYPLKQKLSSLLLSIHRNISLSKLILPFFIILTISFGVFFWKQGIFTSHNTINDDIQRFGSVGASVLQDFQSTSTIAITKPEKKEPTEEKNTKEKKENTGPIVITQNGSQTTLTPQGQAEQGKENIQNTENTDTTQTLFTLTDALKDGEDGIDIQFAKKEDGIDIQFAKKTEQENTFSENTQKQELTVNFSKNDKEESFIDISLPGQKNISVQDNKASEYKKPELLENAPSFTNNENNKESNSENKENNKENETQTTYVKYESKDGRKTTYYGYQKDQALGERTLKQWTLYRYGEGKEQEAYTINNAKLKKNKQGEVEVYFFSQQEAQNEQVKAEVDANLLERAHNFLAKELGDDMEQSIGEGKKLPDIIIPKPYFIDNQNEKHELSWEVNDIKHEISIELESDSSWYPLALDPTLMFTVPGAVITGETSSQFGYAMTSGDFNSDGKIDLAVGANIYSSRTGRAYIFYNDGSISVTAADADIAITGEAVSNYFGWSLISSDFNTDGKTDLAVGAVGYSDDTGRAYIFYNDGSIPTTAATADVIITGEAVDSYFGTSLIFDDFNSDGKADFVVGAPYYSSNTGRTYIFYNDGSIPTTASAADISITGEAANTYFGVASTAADFNSDGKIDLVVGARGDSSYPGRAYIFYSDGSVPATAETADIIITGESTNNRFGWSFTVGDFNSDGKIDLAVGAAYYSSSTGRTYLFYNDGSISTTAATADVIITGEMAGSNFSKALTSGDFNADGKIDLAVGASFYSSYTGRAYIFYNDGSIPTTAAGTITGRSTSSYFGTSLLSGDFNSDGKVDLAIGAIENFSNTGRVSIITTEVKYAERVVARLKGSYRMKGSVQSSIDAVAFNCGTSTVTDADGNVYATVPQVGGSQCWMAENIRTTKYPDGSSITRGPTGATWDGNDNAYYAYPSNVTNTAEESLANIQANKLGFVYQWSAAMNGSTTQGAQGICPADWHIPTDAEWFALEDYLSPNTCTAGRQTWECDPAGTLLKASPMSIPLSGLRNTDGSFLNRTSFAYVWSSLQFDASNSWRRYLQSGGSTVQRDYNPKARGLPVRCLKN